MTGWPDELRLAAAIAISALVFVSCLRTARRLVPGDPVQTLIDALLLWYLAQYLAVGAAGLLGVLNFATICAAAIALCAAMSLIPGSPLPHAKLAAAEGWVLGAAMTFVAAEVVAAIAGARLLPPLANDALTYHLPAAVSWLQSGRLSLFDTWFHNPANTYSPLAGSMFMAWLIAPLGNDAVARFVQAPAMLFVLLAMVQLGRALGASVAVSAIVATAAVLSRPFVSQSILAKDDLFVAAFFVSALVALTPDRLSERIGAWRVGIALGLLLATKYTVLMSLPLLALMLDGPARGGWRAWQWAIALLVILILAGPWYLRNLVLAGNPLYPTAIPPFAGLFQMARSTELATAAGAWKALVAGYYSLTVWAALPLACLWCAAVCIAWKRLVRSPIVRTAILGPPLGIALFMLLSPYPEIRFVYPSLLLMYGCAAIVAASASGGWAIALALLLASAGSGFIPTNLARILPTAIGMTVAILLVWRLLCAAIRDSASRAAIASIIVAALLACAIYVYWPGYLRRPIDGYSSIAATAWRGGGYGALADAWEFVRAQPAGAGVAYTNTSFVYPLHGFDLSRPVTYIPTRSGLSRWTDLPPATGRLSGEQIETYVRSALAAQPDHDAWLARLRDSHARFLFVARGDGPPPAELRFAQADPARFAPRFDNPAAAIFEILPSPVR